MKADVKRAHFFGSFEWRLKSDHYERSDRRGYRWLFDRVFYDEIESMTVFRQPDAFIFVRGLVVALLVFPPLLLIDLGNPGWGTVALVVATLFAASVAVLGFAAFVRRKTVLRLRTTAGDREIVFNKSPEFERSFVLRLTSLIRSAQLSRSPDPGANAP